MATHTGTSTFGTDPTRTTDDRRTSGEPMFKDARGQAESVVDSGREQVASQLDGLGRALRRAGTAFRDEEQRYASYCTDYLGDKTDAIAGYLRTHDAASLEREISGMARSRPAWFIGGAFVAGLALGRFLKSGSSHRRQPHTDEPSGPRIATGSDSSVRQITATGGPDRMTGPAGPEVLASPSGATSKPGKTMMSAPAATDSTPSSEKR